MNPDRNTISAIREFVALSVGADPAMLAQRIRYLDELSIDHIGPDLMAEAEKAKADTIGTLRKMREAIVGSTAAERRRYAERRVEDRREAQRRAQR